VARALGHLANDADVIVPKFIALLDRPSRDYTRRTNVEHATEGLGLLGPKAKAAIPRLRQLLEDDDNAIADAAARALAKIETK
jgi:HEAT repeat protein